METTTTTAATTTGLSVYVWFCPAAWYHFSYAAVGVTCIGLFDVAMSEGHVIAAFLTDLPATSGHVCVGSGGIDYYVWGTAHFLELQTPGKEHEQTDCFCWGRQQQLSQVLFLAICSLVKGWFVFFTCRRQKVQEGV